MGRRQRLLLTPLTGAYAASLAPGWRRHQAAARDPEAAQDRLLQALLTEVRDTAQGRALGLGRVSSFRDLQDRVPIRTYEDYRPEIERIARGEPGVLTRAPVRMLERSSGSTGGNKLVPYTDGLLGDFSAATAPWLFSLYAARPRLLGTTSYWSLSPAARAPEVTEGGLRVGFEDDTEYFGPVARWALSKLMSVPSAVARLPDMAAWRRATARRLIADGALGLISVWNPSFLTLLMEAVRDELQATLPQLPEARRAELGRGLDAHGRVVGPALWPRLQVVSCWTDGHAARALPPLQADFPGVELQPKGLLATEGVFSFPLSPLRGPPAPGPVAAVASHVLELIDLQAPEARPLRLHEARVGAAYSPLLSTRGGLLRYHLQDAVRCVGMLGKLPCFRFEGKLDRTSDLVGEKLTAGDAERALSAVEAAVGPLAFGLLAPDPGAAPPRYLLFLEARPEVDLAAAAGAAEAALLAAHHYRYARELGQLGPVAARPVRDGAARFQAALVVRGTRAGDIKPTPLDNRLFWSEVLGP
jgi:hypothetical protein